MNALRCKVGDLAIVVRARPEYSWALGRILRCVKQYTDFGEIAWEVEPALVDRSGYRWRGITDEMLKPIRDPGSDAKDETLTWLTDKVDA